jgi:hypothetical protein
MRRLLALSFLALSACSYGSVPVNQARPVLIANAQEPYMIRAAIVRALDARRFTAEADAPGRVVARYVNGDRWFRVNVDYSTTQFTVSYVDSGGMETFVDPETQALMIDGRYGRWVTNLERSIESEIDRPYREAAEAEAARREYELAMAAEQRRAAEASAEAEALRRQPVPAPSPVPLIVQGVQSLPIPPIGVGGGASFDASHRQSTQSLTCCINGAFYACPGQAAFNECLSSGPSQCTRDASRDGQC